MNLDIGNKKQKAVLLGVRPVAIHFLETLVALQRGQYKPNSSSNYFCFDNDITKLKNQESGSSSGSMEDAVREAGRL